MSHRTVILLLGSNLGDQKKNLEEALSEIKLQIGRVLQISNFLYSEPVEFVSSNIFCNIAASVNTILSPVELLRVIKKVEQKMGREFDSSFYEGEYRDRIIDIDIVKIEDLHFECNKLSIPHKKHLEERQFSKEILNNLINFCKT